MTHYPKIPDAELEVMNVIWADHPLTANQIVDALADRREWDPRTIKTLINRLHNKGAVGFDKEGRRYLYFPLISRNEYILSETKTFLSKFRSESLRPVLSTFIEEVRFSDEEIAELKKMLEKKGNG